MRSVSPAGKIALILTIASLLALCGLIPVCSAAPEAGGGSETAARYFGYTFW
ncbi:hypothetical protein [Methanocrinis sp.]|uniref:hypothetical protein n=1 Tax=Methanocrinis sp. TaxID=3101522 RepID=UPI003D0B6E65